MTLLPSGAAEKKGSFIDLLFEHFDDDHDGKLSRAEAPPRLAAAFDSIDSNHDGLLDREELQRVAALLARAAPNPAAGGKK